MSVEAFETFEHAGLKVELHYDDAPEHQDPREYDNVGTMVCWHDRATLGDEQLDRHTMTFEVPCDRCNGEGWREIGRWNVDCAKCGGQGEVDVHPVEHFKRTRGARVVLPLYLYEHGGMTMRTTAFGDPWDSGQVGFIFDTPKGLHDCWGPDATDEQITEVLKGEVELYDTWLRGEVYGYIVTGPDGEDIPELLPTGTPDFSCWGYLGELDYVRSEARRAADECAKALADEEREAAEMAARDITTV